MSSAVLHARAHGTLIVKLTAAAVTYVFSIFLARMMSAQDFGQVVFFLNMALLLSVVGAIGQQTALVRFLPTLADKPNSQAQLVRHAGVRAGLGTAITACIVCIATLLASGFGAFPGFTDTTLILGYSLVLVVGLADFVGFAARGFHRIILSLLPKEVLWRGLVLTGVAGAYIWNGHHPLTAQQVLVALLVVLVALTLGQIWLLRAHFWPIRENKEDTPPNWRRTSVPFWVTSVSNIFLANADVVAVGMLLGAEPAAYYFAANRLAMVLGFFMTSYNIVLQPLLAEAWGKRDMAAVTRLVHQSCLKMSVPTLALAIPLVLFAGAALRLFGTEFSNAAPALCLLVAAGVVNALSGPADIALNMCGHERAAMRISAVCLGANAALLIGATVMAGSIGTAGAVLVGTALRKGLFLLAARQRIGVRTDIFAALSRHPGARSVGPA